MNTPSYVNSWGGRACNLNVRTCQNICKMSFQFWIWNKHELQDKNILLGNYLQSANWKSCWKLWVKKSMFNFGTPFLAGGSQSSWRQKPHHKTLVGLLLEMIFQGFWLSTYLWGFLKPKICSEFSPVCPNISNSCKCI